MNARSVIVSLHDVAPLHLPRLRKAEALFRKLGVGKVQYLFVPEFHRQARSSRSPEFVAWCREPRSFAVDWWLHGYYHVEDARVPGKESLGAVDRLKRRFLTAGEGEFLALDAAEQGRRLDAGLEEFGRCFPGAFPGGFVAPAWLFRPEVLLPVLRGKGFAHTEDHRRVYAVSRNASLASPVITWATRTPLYKYGSLLVCPLRSAWFRKDPVLRIALHPHDFDHPETEANLAGVLRRELERRVPVFLRELNFESMERPNF